MSKEDLFDSRLLTSIKDEVARRVAEQTKVSKKKAKDAHEARQAAEVERRKAVETLGEKKLECRTLVSQVEELRGMQKTSKVTIEALQKSLTEKG